MKRKCTGRNETRLPHPSRYIRFTPNTTAPCTLAGPHNHICVRGLGRRRRRAARVTQIRTAWDLRLKPPGPREGRAPDAPQPHRSQTRAPEVGGREIRRPHDDAEGVCLLLCSSPHTGHATKARAEVACATAHTSQPLSARAIVSPSESLAIPPPQRPHAFSLSSQEARATEGAGPTTRAHNGPTAYASGARGVPARRHARTPRAERTPEAQRMRTPAPP